MARDDDFSEATKKTIAARSGYVCAYPGCHAPTSGPALDGTTVNVGIAAHITAAAEGGPRYDKDVSSEYRRSAENGIWMCGTHANLIDRDDDRFSTRLLQEWKQEAEFLALKNIGVQQGSASGKLAIASQAARVGSETAVLVDGQPIAHTYIFSPREKGERLTWFVNAFVAQFSIQKNFTMKKVVINHLLVTVHETRAVPKYKLLMGVYPASANLYYVEIDANYENCPREFRPTRYYIQASNATPEKEDYPPSIVLDNDDPAQIAIRLNARREGMYLVSLAAEISSGETRETLLVMQPQWIIFEESQDDYDPKFGA